MTGYLTIAGDAEAEIEVKRSRFRCTLRRVEDETTARAVVERLRRDHWDARHHCSAFRLGPGPQPVERSSDDGEPAGTAGAPMLEVLRGHAGAGVSDVVAVVTRWFGGTLLGAGGLVRAYSEAVRLALAEAGGLRRELLGIWSVALTHDVAGRIETELRAAGATVLETTYAERVGLRLGVAPVDLPRVEALLAAATGGTGRMAAVRERWVDIGES
ncbi:MAG: YigZ family protein [Nocardioides sp.]|uniref:IMPACT family protein n=1 Tax=Nocardioides sp. TaxID=35761 RepID=UPI0039E6DD99